MRIGGPADYFFIAKSTEEIKEAISYAKAYSLPYFLISGGTNILFSDEGFRGLVIKIDTHTITHKDDTLTADAGVTIKELIAASIDNNLQGLEPWNSLPGTVGGAVRGNAGCNGLETTQILTQATILDPETNKTKTVTPKDLDLSYRHSSLKDSDEILLSATFQLTPRTIAPEEQRDLLEKHAETRTNSQPPGFSCGSFFKNPSPEQPAGMLIDQAGLKGHIIGDPPCAKFSEKHANFLINLGQATQKDILALASLAKSKVQEKFGITLKEEVQVLSEHGKTPLQ